VRPAPGTGEVPCLALQATPWAAVEGAAAVSWQSMEPYLAAAAGPETAVVWQAMEPYLAAAGPETALRLVQTDPLALVEAAAVGSWQ
jgi:hypothetical protein